jgi:hypothetical protein
MFTAKELKKLKVGDEIESGHFIFEGLPDEEYICFTVARTTAKLVEFDLTYFGVNIGNWVAKPCADGSIVWLDQGKSRKDAGKKGYIQ